MTLKNPIESVCSRAGNDHGVYSRAVSSAVRQGLLGDKNPVAFFYQVDALRSQCKSLINAFPTRSLHCFAVKACPVVSVLQLIHDAGLGAECASIGEVALSLAAGFSPEHIVFDSPVKTDAHISHCVSKGIHLNADNLEELERIDELRTQASKNGNLPAMNASTIGLRVNPQIGEGSISELYTASASSKFGVPVTEMRSGIVDAFLKYSFLECLHVHVGSQGCSVDDLVNGAAVAVGLADEINLLRPGQVTCIDIGGGLSVDYDSDVSSPPFAEYSAELRKRVPNLFRYKILTEFGRVLIAKAGWAAAHVQHVKRAGGRVIALCHAGADVFLRPVYIPSKWKHRIQVMSSDGFPRTDPVGRVDVGGPLCFTGDLLCVDRVLPVPQTGDWIIIRDAGAYTLSMCCRHTSQLLPPVYGYESAQPADLKILKKGETTDDIVQFWS